uniref:RRM domain-containing protein n=1 Tax=Knipowitschia caucasica TaxID=637954 RepID=A0AAV2KRS5_KNICA
MEEVAIDHYVLYFQSLAQDEGSPVRGFGVVEYESAEQAEAVLTEMDRTSVSGHVIRLSLCSPGTSGRSTLAALIAAQGMILSNRKGLLPEPNIAQLLTSMTNPAALQILMRPYHTGKRGGKGKFGHHSGLPFLRPPLTTALLTLGKAHQNAMIGNGLVLQNLLHMQLAQQQLLHIKDKRLSSVSSLLGDPSKLLIQKALSLRPPGLLPLGKGLLGDSPLELGQEAVPVSCHNSPAGTMPYPHTRASTGEQHSGHPLSMIPTVPTSSSSSGCTERQLAPPGTMVNNGQSSLLGDPPKEVRLPSNPYLNLASVMPSVVLQGSSGAKAQVGQAATLYSGPPIASQTSSSFSHSVPTTSAPYSTDTAVDYSQYNQAYTQEAMHQWYQHYQAAAQTHTYTTAPPDAAAVDHTQAPPVTTYADYNSYLQAVTQYYSQPATATQAYATKEVDVCKPMGVSLHAVSNGTGPPPAVLPAAAVLPAYSALPLVPSFLGPPHHHAAPPAQVAHTAAPDWSSYYYNQTRGHKREYPQLAVQEVAPSDGAYIGQHSQGLGGQYADYFKRKRL